jgi:hypothetical protein
MAKMYGARAERARHEALVRKGREDARRRREREKLAEAKEALDDQEAVRDALGMAMPKEIRDNIELLKTEGKSEMSDDEFEALIDKYPIVDKDADTKSL